MCIEFEGNYDLSNFDKFKSIFKNDHCLYDILAQ